MKKTAAAPTSGAKTIRPLDEAEAALLVRCEALIERDADTPAEAGEALRSIRDGSLYRMTHGTFDSYCGERWNISRNRAYQLIDASAVAENPSPIGSEAQLSLLPPDEAGEQGMRLQADEAAALEQHEAVIERGIKTFYEVGTALLHIRDERLYRETHDSFEAYCQGRWNMTRRYADYVMAASTVMGNLRTRVLTSSASADETPSPVAIPLPVTEKQVRPLASLAPEHQRSVWRQAIEESDGKQPTALKVSELSKLVRDRTVERRGEVGIVEPITITQRNEDEPPPLSKRELRRMDNERKSRVYDIMSAIDTLNEPGFPPSDLVAHIRRTYPPEWIVVTEVDNALRNLQMIVKELHQ